MPSALIVPHADAAHPGPVSDHDTPAAGWPLLAIEAVNDCFVPGATLAVAGASCTLTSLVTVTDALALLSESAWLVATICMFAGEGRIAGAWYMPEALIAPIVAFPPEIPFTDHPTAVSEVPLTLAANPTALP